MNPLEKMIDNALISAVAKTSPNLRPAIRSALDAGMQPKIVREYAVARLGKTSVIKDCIEAIVTEWEQEQK